MLFAVVSRLGGGWGCFSLGHLIVGQAKVIDPHGGTLLVTSTARQTSKRISRPQRRLARERLAAQRERHAQSETGTAVDLAVTISPRMRRHCLVHSVGVASLITDCLERDGLQRLGIVTAGFRIESKRKHKKKAK